MWSVGGGKTEQAKLFSKVASTDSGRKLFASSVVSLVSDYGLDGIDLDWEYPEGQEDPNNFVSLLKTTREALDKYAKDNSQDYHYLLTV
ncbi:glycosyl hydrolase family 18 protein, partial [Mycobacterium tuberculosis]|uniref:glycosyl hydrolase family 18 protein n=1 Tax=Mycobacterium tuberculosis TaxID=1773 RepID=UPI0034DB368F